MTSARSSGITHLLCDGTTRKRGPTRPAQPQPVKKKRRKRRRKERGRWERGEKKERRREEQRRERGEDNVFLRTEEGQLRKGKLSILNSAVFFRTSPEA